MVDITFNAEKREKAGKGAARACRREGRVPAVIYGGKQEPVMISLHPVELEKALDMVGFYDADIEVVVDGKKFKVSCQDVQFHPVSDRPIHVDFLRKSNCGGPVSRGFRPFGRKRRVPAGDRVRFSV